MDSILLYVGYWRNFIPFIYFAKVIHIYFIATKAYRLKIWINSDILNSSIPKQLFINWLDIKRNITKLPEIIFEALSSTAVTGETKDWWVLFLCEFESTENICHQIKMLVIISFLFMRSISVLAEEEQQTWVNQHPGLEQIVSDGLVEAINVYDKSLNAIIDVPDFQYRSNPADKVQKVFNAWRGELRKMKSIVRDGGLNVTRLNKDRRELSFFVKLNLMEITYHIYNQSNFGFPKEGKIIIRPDSNLILVKCAAVRETVDDAYHVIKSWAHVMNATIVSLSAGNATVRLFPSDNPDRPDYMNVNDINAVSYTHLDVYKRQL